ncbi:hypothetical protein [Nocardiopsis flavescens]
MTCLVTLIQAVRPCPNTLSKDSIGYTKLFKLKALIRKEQAHPKEDRAVSFSVSGNVRSGQRRPIISNGQVNALFDLTSSAPQPTQDNPVLELGDGQLTRAAQLGVGGLGIFLPLRLA